MKIAELKNLKQDKYKLLYSGKKNTFQTTIKTFLSPYSSALDNVCQYTFLPTGFKQAMKMTMFQIDQNYGKIEDVSEIPTAVLDNSFK